MFAVFSRRKQHIGTPDRVTPISRKLVTIFGTSSCSNVNIGTFWNEDLSDIVTIFGVFSCSNGKNWHVFDTTFPKLWLFGMRTDYKQARDNSNSWLFVFKLMYIIKYRERS